MTQEIINRLKELLPQCNGVSGGPWNVSGYQVRINFTDKRAGCEVFHLVKTLAFDTLTNLTPSGVERIRAEAFDPRTGRPLGDHGTANDAIEFILEYGCEADPFLRAWQQGDLDEWPEFYAWLAALPSEPPSQGDVEGRARELPETLDGHWETVEGRDIALDYLGMGRADLCKGNLPDLVLANGVFLASRYDLDLIGWQTAAKERIRWLSAQLAAAALASKEDERS